jgi:hypothetical protein
MSLRGRKNLPVGSSISSWAGAPAILDDIASPPRGMLRSLAEEPIVRRILTAPLSASGSIESTELRGSAAVCDGVYSF